jgi:hypothetical protein
MDETWYRVSRHEAAHAASALCLGWQVKRVSRSRGWAGGTRFERPPGGDVSLQVHQLAVILIVPMLLDSEGCSDDLSKVDSIVRAGTRLSAVLDTATRLIDEPNFARRRRAIESRLLVQPTLVGDVIARLV